MAITPVCASLLAGAYGWIRTSGATDLIAITTELARAQAGIQAAEQETARVKARGAELQPILRAAKAVGDQPDWGTLLTLVASRLGHDALLSAAALTPETAASVQ